MDSSQNKRKKLLKSLRKKLNQTNRDDDKDASTSEEEKSVPERKKSKIMLGNKLAERQTRAIELGWIHEGQQVRKQTGGGTRKLTVPKEANASDITKHATELFFPNGESKRGIKLEDVHIDICDFSMIKTLDSETVAETYEKEKPVGILRWYLATTMKVSDKASTSSGEANTSSKKKASAKLQPVELNCTPTTSLHDTPTTATCEQRDTVTGRPNMKTSPVSGKVLDVQTPEPDEQDTTASTQYGQGKTTTCVNSTDPRNELYPVLNGEVCLSREPINISYVKNTSSSLYSGNISWITAYSRSQCFIRTLMMMVTYVILMLNTTLSKMAIEWVKYPREASAFFSVIVQQIVTWRVLVSLHMNSHPKT